jgi:hypothetical protein
MTLFAPSDARAINLPGGCGNQHTRPDEDAPWALDCAACETVLPKEFGWAPTPDGVLPTWDEARQAERDEARAQRAGWSRMANEIAGAAQPAAQAPSLIEQIARMTPAEKDALRALLGGGETTVQKTEKAADTEAPAPAKRAAKKAAPKTTDTASE